MNEEVKKKAKRLYNSLERFSEHDCESNSSWDCKKCDFEMSDDELEEVLKEQLEDYEQYWIDCIIVHGRN